MATLIDYGRFLKLESVLIFWAWDDEYFSNLENAPVQQYTWVTHNR